MSSHRTMLSQHAVDRLRKSNVLVTDDSYKYSYQRTPDGYGKAMLVLYYCHHNVFIHLFIYLCSLAGYLNQLLVDISKTWLARSHRPSLSKLITF